MASRRGHQTRADSIPALLRRRAVAAPGLPAATAATAAVVVATTAVLWAPHVFVESRRLSVVLLAVGLACFCLHATLLGMLAGADRWSQYGALMVTDAGIRNGLKKFAGVKRRFTTTGYWNEVRIVDDYTHYPVEIAAVLSAAREMTEGRVLAVVQPHRYTRTRDCFEDFVKVIGQADAVLLAEVYAAGEAPIVAADGRALARALRLAGRVEPLFVDDIAAMPDMAIANARDGDVLMCMGAGSIGAVPGKVADLLQKEKLSTQEGQGL